MTLPSPVIIRFSASPSAVPMSVVRMSSKRTFVTSSTGAGSLAQVVNAAIGNRERFVQMREFFEGVGEGDSAGVWHEKPVAHPEFRAEVRRQIVRLHKKRKAEEMV